MKMKFHGRVEPSGGTRDDGLQAIQRPDGPAIAALMAAGVGALLLGVLTTLAEVSASVKDWLNLYDPVGPLAGKTTFAVIAFVVAWGVLHPILRKTPRLTDRHLVIVGTLIFLGFLGTFPTFFQFFAAE